MTRLFPLWALLACLVAIVLPGWFLPLKPAIVPLLGMVMFAMGTSLTGHNFLTVMQRTFPVVLGVTLQFLLMPLLAWSLVRVFDLPLRPAVGLMLVGCCPGGTASNVICYLARGDVALSITLTAASTLLAMLLGLLVSGLVLRYGLGAESLAWVAIFAVASVSGIYYPIAILPDWLQIVAWILPSSHVFEGMRAVMFEHVIRYDHLLQAMALNALFLALGTGVFLRAFNSARLRGLLLHVGE